MDLVGGGALSLFGVFSVGSGPQAQHVNGEPSRPGKPRAMGRLSSEPLEPQSTRRTPQDVENAGISHSHGVERLPAISHVDAIVLLRLGSSSLSYILYTSRLAPYYLGTFLQGRSPI